MSKPEASELRVEPLGESTARAWGALFDRSSSGCFCRWWHFAGTKNDWLARCALDPEANRADAEGAIRRGADDALGLVAIAGDEVVGWMKLAPRASLPKLRGLPVYRARDLGADDGVWSIGCFLIDPRHRRRGVARALVAAAGDHVRAREGRAIEAYPRHPVESDHGDLHDEQAWMGPERVFVDAGFRPIEAAPPLPAYPVYRLELAEK